MKIECIEECIYKALDYCKIPLTLSDKIKIVKLFHKSYMIEAGKQALEKPLEYNYMKQGPIIEVSTEKLNDLHV